MVLQEILKTRSKDSQDSAATDEEKRRKAPLRGSKSNDVPPPRYLFSVYSPIVFTSEADVRSEETEELYRSVWKPYATKEESSRSTADNKDKNESPSVSTAKTKKKKIRVRMASLIIKMLNRMISDGVLLSERVLVTTTASQVFARLLVSDKIVPMLIMRCERIGIGNVVGACWVTPIELAVVPAANAGGKPDESLLLLDDLSKRGYRTPSPLKTPQHHYSPSEEVDLSELRLLGEKGTPFGGDVHPLLRAAEGSLESEAKEQALGSSDMRLGLERDESNESVISIGASDIGDSFDNIGPLMDDGDTESLEEGNLRKRDVLMKAAKDVELAKKKWVSIASRMRIEQVLQEVESGASLSFDYICYTIIAAWIAGFGLATDSSTVVIASMLVSPLMGPCMGFTFGAMVREWPLVLSSLRNELLSLMLCVLVGFIVGLMFLSDAFSPTYNEWPSNEMISRGEELGLLYGVFVAIPSGAAVALAQLGKNSGGLTGVAISLSLLPPAVNAGLCWCTALLVKTGANPPPTNYPEHILLSEHMGCDVEDGYLWCNALSRCLLRQDLCPLHNSTSTNSSDVVGGGEEYGGDDIGGGRLLLGWPEQNDDDTTNYARVGTISFVLTIINIGCIFIGGCCMFWLKEVVPIKRKNTFWTHDVKAYRQAKRENNSRKTEIEAIERGIRASIMLNEKGRLAKSLEPQKVATGSNAKLQNNKYASTGLLDQIEADELRHNFASNAIEDAFFVSNVQPRPVSSRNLRRRHHSPRDGDNRNNAPSLFTIDEDAEQEGDNVSRERESFIRTANRMGGLSRFESVLFFEDEDSSRTLHEEASFRTRRRLAMGLGNWISSRLPTRNERRADVALHLSTVS